MSEQQQLPSWSAMTNLVTTKNLKLQYVEWGDRYEAFVTDNIVEYFSYIYLSQKTADGKVLFNRHIRVISAMGAAARR